MKHNLTPSYYQIPPLSDEHKKSLETPALDTPKPYSLDTIEQKLQEARAQAEKIRAGIGELQKQQQPADMPGVYGDSQPTVIKDQKTVQDVKDIMAGFPGAKDAQTTSDSYTAQLQKEYDALEQRRKDEVKAIEEQFSARKEQTQEAQKRETGTTSVALQRIGGYLGGSASAMGALLNLAKNHRQELSLLESKKQAAIQQANSAITDKKFDIARLMADEAKSIEQEINDRKEKFFNDSMSLIKEKRIADKEEAKAEADKKKFAAIQANEEIDRIITAGDTPTADEMMSFADAIGTTPERIQAIIAAKQETKQLEKQKKKTSADITLKNFLIKVKKGQFVNIGGKNYEGMKDKSDVEDKIYNIKTIPGDLRNDIIEDLTDEETLKELGGLTIKDLSVLYPEVSINALRDLYEEFYQFDGTEDNGSPWYKFWK